MTTVKTFKKLDDACRHVYGKPLSELDWFTTKAVTNGKGPIQYNISKDAFEAKV